MEGETYPNASPSEWSERDSLGESDTNLRAVTNGDPDVGTCSMCGKRGTCTCNATNRKRTATTRCQICGSEGHFARECPMFSAKDAPQEQADQLETRRSTGAFTKGQPTNESLDAAAGSCPTSQRGMTWAPGQNGTTLNQGPAPGKYLETLNSILENLVDNKSGSQWHTKRPLAALRVMTPKKYDGKAVNLKSFERAYRAYAKLCATDEETAKVALGTYMDDAAARWYDQLGDKTHMTLDDIFEKMRERFCPL